jgi:hypothetical protein
MALNIKDPETERLAAEVATLTGESKTAAVRAEDVLASVQRPKVGAPTRAEADIVLFAKFGIRGKTSLLRFLALATVGTPQSGIWAIVSAMPPLTWPASRSCALEKDFVQTDLALVPLGAE